MKSNNVGSRYVIQDGGLAPDKTVAPSMLRREFGVVSFEFNSGGPSHIEAWVPFVSAGGVAVNWQPVNEAAGMEAAVDALIAAASSSSYPSSSSGSGASGAAAAGTGGQASRDSVMSDAVNGSNGGNKLFYLQNKAPKWDEAHGGHVLNFQVYLP